MGQRKPKHDRGGVSIRGRPTKEQNLAQNPIMKSRDYYEILEVEKDSDAQKIRDAYRRLAFEFHPDRNPDPAAASKMKAVNEAYAVLSNPQKREQYDAMQTQFGSSAHTHFRQNFSEQDIFRGSDIHQIFEEISRSFGFRGFNEVFMEFYGPGYQKFEFHRPGGFSFNFPMGGTFGKLLRYGLKKKWGVELPEHGKDQHDVIRISPKTAQMGGRIRYLYRKKSKELLVRVPKGIREGQQIRLKGMGDEGKGGAGPGDLYLNVKIKRPILQKIKEYLRRVP
jgi:curved DNA-binding protein CbpA